VHELGIMTGVLDSVCASAKEAGATRVISVDLSIGEMTEAIEDALVFAFDALQDLQEYALCKGATLNLHLIGCKSRCLECGAEYEHDRFHPLCPNCESFATQLIAGREMQIDSIEVDLPDDGE